MNAKTYRLYTYDVWGNEEDGFDVNDVFWTGDTLEISEGEDVIKRLVEEGIAETGRVEVDQNTWSEDTIYLVSTEHGNPVAELREEPNRRGDRSEAPRPFLR